MKIPLASPVFDDEMKKAAVDALCSERFVLGESVFRFEGVCYREIYLVQVFTCIADKALC